MVNLLHDIVTLLKQHDCVVLPDFGGFIKRYRSAEIHPVTHVIKPPSAELSFNAQLTADDKVLSQHIALQKGIELQTADQLVRDFVSEIQVKLTNSGQLILPGIGRLYHDVEGNLQFAAAQIHNFDIKSFGLKELNLRPIIRERKTAIEKPVVPLNEEVSTPKQNTNNKYGLLAAACVAAFIMVFANMIIGNWGYQNEGAATSDISMIGHVPNTSDTGRMIPADDLDRSFRNHAASVTPFESANTQKLAIEEPIISDSNLPFGYYAVIGVFKNQDNAKSLSNQLVDDGYPSMVSQTPNGWYRVSYFVSSSSSVAEAHLTDLRQYVPDAWLTKR